MIPNPPDSDRLQPPNRPKPRADFFAIFTYVVLSGAILSQVAVIVWLVRS